MYTDPLSEWFAGGGAAVAGVFDADTDEVRSYMQRVNTGIENHDFAVNNAVADGKIGTDYTIPWKNFAIDWKKFAAANQPGFFVDNDAVLHRTKQYEHDLVEWRAKLEREAKAKVDLPPFEPVQPQTVPTPGGLMGNVPSAKGLADMFGELKWVLLIGAALWVGAPLLGRFR